jgi:hypothetical protein
MIPQTIIPHLIRRHINIGRRLMPTYFVGKFGNSFCFRRHIKVQEDAEVF